MERVRCELLSGADRGRTGDLRLATTALFQLSYGPSRVGVVLSSSGGPGISCLGSPARSLRFDIGRMRVRPLVASLDGTCVGGGRHGASHDGGIPPPWNVLCTGELASSERRSRGRSSVSMHSKVMACGRWLHREELLLPGSGPGSVDRVPGGGTHTSGSRARCRPGLLTVRVDRVS